MKVLIIHRDNENEDHINILKNVLNEKGIQSQSASEDKKLHFTSNHQSWVRDCVLGYDLEGNERYNGFILIGRYMDDFAYKFVQMAFLNAQPLYFVADGQIKQLTRFKIDDDTKVVTDE